MFVPSPPAIFNVFSTKIKCYGVEEEIVINYIPKVTDIYFDTG